MSSHTKNGLYLSRRRFLSTSALAAAGVAGTGLAGGSLFPAPAFARSDRPVISHGLQSGDVTTNSAMVWARADRPSRLLLEYATSDSFRNARAVRGPAALEVTDFTAKVDLTGLPAGQDIFYRVRFQDLGTSKAVSEPMVGRFRTAPADRRDVAFVWTGDTCGQGWGINTDWGGMKGYDTMRRNTPDFMIHSGDTIYADGPIQAEQKLPDGSIWKNLVTEEKSKVAETLKEFRGAFRYNLMDANVRAFNAEVPVFAQWDDHETLDNWYPNEVLNDDRYTVRSVATLAARANRAFHEYMPIREFASDRERVYRVVNYGPLLDVFFLDMRSYRGDNGANRQPVAGPDTAYLGADQIRWLKRALLASKATWKVIAADMPIGIIVYDNWREKNTFENSANGNGPVLGREFEIADLLRFIKHNRIKNTVWLTADVHYTAAHYYDPDKAQFSDFEPFWEFVSGPIHAGSFGPGEMDNTFGPQVVYVKSPDGRPNLPPSEGLQFFGHVRIDGDSEVMTVTLKDIDNQSLYSIDLNPVPVG